VDHQLWQVAFLQSLKLWWWIVANLKTSSKPYLFALNLKNSFAPLLRYVFSIQSTPILLHKLTKSPVFLQATINKHTYSENLIIRYYISKSSRFLFCFRPSHHYKLVKKSDSRANMHKTLILRLGFFFLMQNHVILTRVGGDVKLG